MSTMKNRRRAEPDGPQPPQEVIDRLAGLLPDGALDDAVRGLRPEELSGPGGLLSQLAGRVVEAALEAEITEHLGHPPGGVPRGRGAGGPGRGGRPTPPRPPPPRGGAPRRAPTSATAPPPRRPRATWGRSRSRRPATARARSSRRSCPSARRGWPASTRRSSGSTPAA